MDTKRRREVNADEFRTIIARSMDGFLMVDIKGYIIEANVSYCRLFGYSRDEILNMHISEIDPIDSVEDVAKRTSEIIQAGSLRFETKHRHKDGTNIDVEISTHYFPDHGGTLFSFIRDITKPKKTEKALKESEQLFRTLVSASSQSVWSFRPGGLTEIEQIDKANASWWCEFTGQTEFQRTADNGMGWLDAVHDEDQQVALNNWQNILTSGKSTAAEYRVRSRDGDWRWLKVRGVPIKDSQGTITEIAGTVVDITERKQLELQLHQSQRLESLGVLAGGIAHDFNNILTAIMGHCSLAEMKSEQAGKHLREIQIAVARASELCRQMLAYAGKAQFVQSQVNIRSLVDEVIRALSPTVKQNVEITAQLSDDIPLIKADTSQISQITKNLIINAVEAIGELQGKIRVSLTKAEIKAGHEKDYLGKIIPSGWYACLEVADNGCGMSDDVYNRIFEPFYSTKFTGRGLGMSAVLGIVTSSSGALQLSSKPDEGTTVKVYLPEQVRLKVEEKQVEG